MAVQIQVEVAESAREFLADRLATDGASGYVEGQCQMQLESIIDTTSTLVNTDITAFYANIVCDCIDVAQQGWPLDQDVAMRLAEIRRRASGNDRIVISAKH